MKINANDIDACKLIAYSEFPNKYVYQKSKCEWKKRAKGFAVGRMSHVSPIAGELYYLTILLTHVGGPKYFDDIKTFDGVVQPTFKVACFKRGLLDDDREYISALKKAAIWACGFRLHKLFVSMMILGVCIDQMWSRKQLLLYFLRTCFRYHERSKACQVIQSSI